MNFESGIPNQYDMDKGVESLIPNTSEEMTIGDVEDAVRYNLSEQSGVLRKLAEIVGGLGIHPNKYKKPEDLAAERVELNTQLTELQAEEKRMINLLEIKGVKSVDTELQKAA